MEFQDQIELKAYDPKDQRRDVQGEYWANPDINAIMLNDKSIWRWCDVDADCSHVNGFILNEVVTMCSTGCIPNVWRLTTDDGGVIVSWDKKILKKGLSMPHSPRKYKDDILYCEAGNGSLNSLKNGIIILLPGFTRGLKIVGDLAYVGVSKLRYTDDWTMELPIAKRVPSPISGIAIVDLKLKQLLDIRGSHVNEIIDLE